VGRLRRGEGQPHWQQIVDFYYPSTSRTSWGNPTVRVNVTSDTGSYIGIVPASGLQVTAGAGHANPTSRGH